MLYLPSIQLQLCLACSLIAHASTRTTLTTQILAHSHKSRKHILQSRRLHLQLGLSGLCAYGKDIQNQICAVQDGQFQLISQIPDLGGRKRIVEHNLFRLRHCSILLYLRHLTRSDIQGFVYGFHSLHNDANDLLSRCLRQACKLFHGMVEVQLLSRIRTYQKHLRQFCFFLSHSIYPPYLSSSNQKNTPSSLFSTP